MKGLNDSPKTFRKHSSMDSEKSNAAKHDVTDISRIRIHSPDNIAAKSNAFHTKENGPKRLNTILLNQAEDDGGSGNKKVASSTVDQHEAIELYEQAMGTQTQSSALADSEVSYIMRKVERHQKVAVDEKKYMR